MTLRQQQAGARAVLVAAHRRFGRRAFNVDPAGPNAEPLTHAELWGWVTFVGPWRCMLTDAGVNAIRPWLGEAA